MEQVYYYFDGAALEADVQRLKHSHPELVPKRLVLTTLSTVVRDRIARDYYMSNDKTALFYFSKDASGYKKSLYLPEPTDPLRVRTVIVQCGQKAGGANVDAWLTDHSAPQYVLDSVRAGEKAVDTQICCDALQLAGLGRLDHLFLYTNDLDFMPLCKTLRGLGAGVSLLRLWGTTTNAQLAGLCDDVKTLTESQTRDCFVDIAG